MYYHKNYHKNSKTSGFSLIELMVAIGIIAILTTIGTPIYLQYSIKANVASALPILEGLKTQVSEYYITTGTFPSNLSAINATSYTDNKIITSSTVTTTTCPSVVTNQIGCVQVTFNNPARTSFPINGNILSLVAIDSSTTSTTSTAIQWICKSGDNSGNNTISSNYLPTSCQ